MATAALLRDTRYCTVGDQVHIDIRLAAGHAIGKWTYHQHTFYGGGLLLLTKCVERSRAWLVFTAEDAGRHRIDVKITTREGRLLKYQFEVICAGESCSPSC